jgi:hypothetical protein
MNVFAVKDIVKKDTPVHYRRLYTAKAVLELLKDIKVEKKIEFTLEHSATGPIRVLVTILEDIDYPMVPVIAALKEFIGQLEKRGELS